MKVESLLDFSLKDPQLFEEAIGFSATATGFAPEMIEKDYFCTLILDHLAASGANRLVFKGGTCLSKVHAGFYRLSEDLDFTLSTPSEASRKARSNAANPVREVLRSLPDKYPSLQIEQPLTGANGSTQYFALLSYRSIFGEGTKIIKFEVGLREPLLDNPAQGMAKTILLHPVRKIPLLRSIRIPCMSLREAMAEKFRAALTRREVAIRDFYDIDYLVRSTDFDFLDDDFVNLIKAKLALPGDGSPDVSDVRFAGLESQLGSQLKPVLRSGDFEQFDLKRILAIIKNVAGALGQPNPVVVET
ncbi:MAG: nucleotidyl transferase AbiEii/AbiGii toxin family protein [Syntrophorhabdaceae bacterium]|nr:nucleotidyl transferase AbiEii/AbiGii toxin family protein [Syntrophorhabdaceae bacterium]